MRLSLLCTLLILFCKLVVKSQDNSLVVFSEKGIPFILSVNQQTINLIPESNIKIYHVNVGWQVLQFFIKNDEETITLTDSVKIADIEKYRGKEFTYVLKKDKKYYLQFVSVSEPSAKMPLYVPEPPKEKIALVDNSVYGNLYQVKNNKPVFFENYNSDSASCNNSLTENDMSYIVNLFNKINDIELKSRYVKQIIEKNCYTCRQASEIINYLTTEIEKLNLSKTAYFHVTDRHNVDIITAMLTFKSIKESYQNFLYEQKNIEIQKNKQCAEPMPNEKFNALQQKVKHANYDNERLNILKKELVSTCISTNQLSKLSAQFNHDREKIDLFKFSYYIITDKDNFKDLEQELQFTESKLDFNKLILKLK